MSGGLEKPVSAAAVAAELCAAGLGEAEVAAWASAEPRGPTDYNTDCAVYSRFWTQSSGLVGRLPPKPRRDTAEINAAGAIEGSARQHRETSLAAHCETLYELITSARSRFVRVEHFVIEAGAAVPGLAPTREQLVAEGSHLQ